MEMFINGEQETGPPCTIAELVARKGLAPGALVVELNQQIIKQEQWPADPAQGWRSRLNC